MQPNSSDELSRRRRLSTVPEASSDDYEELRRLRQELRSLTEERDIQQRRIAGVAAAFALLTDRADPPSHSFGEAIAGVGAIDVIAARSLTEPAGAPLGLMSLGEAAATVGVSTSTLRRWADDGRLTTVRTPGGHRRFSHEAVRQAVSGLGPRPMVRPVAPPPDAIPALAEQLEAQGWELASIAAASIYRAGRSGWFAAAGAAPALREWLAALARGSESGRSWPLDASEALMRRAYLQGASLLECHSFLGRFGDAAVRALTQASCPHSDISAVRRLFAALQQALLDVHGST